MKIYTKTGDKGETGLLGGKRISKTDPRIRALGEIDELNAAIGVCRSFAIDKKIGAVLENIQKTLFEIGASFRVSKLETEKLEKIIDQYDAKLPELRNFILPGGSKPGSFLHLARTVCRRAERALVKLGQKETLDETVIPYFNRLSDLLFMLARAENKRTGEKEKIWKKSM